MWWCDTWGNFWRQWLSPSETLQQPHVQEKTQRFFWKVGSEDTYTWCIIFISLSYRVSQNRMFFFKKTLLIVGIVADTRSPRGPPFVVGPDNRRGSAGDLAKGIDCLSCGNQQKRYFRNLERRWWEVRYRNQFFDVVCIGWVLEKIW